MKKIKEDFLYYIWRTKQFNQQHLKTIDGKSVEIIDFGFINHHSGPDFSDAQILIDGMLWAGNVEMHIFSSDWENHAHQTDPAYENVILHVVYEHDKKITFHQSKPDLQIPTLELKPYTRSKLIKTYSQLLESKAWIPCSDIIESSDKEKFGLWKYNLVVQRLWNKSKTILDTFELHQQNWDETAYISLSKYFGGVANRIPFEQLAKRTPLNIIRKIGPNLFQLEALFFGQAGFLEANFSDTHFIKLKTEYHHLRIKYALTPMKISVWKFSKMRPNGFPTFRIAQLVATLSNTTNLMSSFIDMKCYDDFITLFSNTPHDYWEEHYRFAISSKHHSTSLSKSFIHRLFINCIVPIKYLYGKQTGNQTLSDECIDILEKLPSEVNNILTKWAQMGISSKSALDSQALIELKNNYCEQQNCMSCTIGHAIFSHKS